jgi:capsular exopolysaccharide synthesis family protein
VNARNCSPVSLMRNVARLSPVTEVRRPENGASAPTNGTVRVSSLAVTGPVREEVEKRGGPEFAIGIEVSEENIVATSSRSATDKSAGDGNKIRRPGNSRSWWDLLLGGRSNIQREELGLIAQQEEFAEGNEQFALLTTRLRRWVEEQQKQVILVTSAVPGEGKSFVALNLAAALAKAETDVLLIDADLRKPSLHRWLNVNPSNGLAEYLSGNLELTRFLHATSVPRLTLLPSGNPPRAGSSLFAGLRLRELLHELRTLDSRPLVLVDAPPILTAPEVQILADLLDTVMMVVAANKTSRAVVQKALEAVKETPLFGMVLNRFEAPFSAARAITRREPNK